MDKASSSFASRLCEHFDLQTEIFHEHSFNCKHKQARPDDDDDDVNIITPFLEAECGSASDWLSTLSLTCLLGHKVFPEL